MKFVVNYLSKMESDNVTQFGKWRSRLWPIHSYELKKIIPLLLLKFFISLVYSVLTTMKDTLVVTASHSGAEVIPVLKGWVVLPIAILATIIYSKLSNKIKPSTLFYGLVTFFLCVVAIYGFVLYPNMEALSPHASADWLTEAIGEKYSHWIAIYRNWIHTVFFVTAELWATLIIFLMFWGFANSITRVGEAKRTYTLFIAAGDIGALLTGPLVIHYCQKYAGLPFTMTLQVLVTYVLLFGLAILGIYWWMQKYVLTDKRFYDPAVMGRGLKKKTKLSLTQSIKHIASSKYLLSIAMLVVGCALTINMVEVTWKANLKLLHPDPSHYQVFMGNVTSSVGLFALITVLLFGGSSLRVFGWKFSALITPVIIGGTGLIFFSLSLFREYLGPLSGLLGMTPLVLIVLFGAFQNVASKVVKYSFFDSTKEMVYIPLDQESKTKGKAAIDVVGSRFGKSGSSWIQIGLIEMVGTGSVLTITPFLLPIIAGAIISWMFAVRYLSKEFTAQDQSLSLSS